MSALDNLMITKEQMIARLESTIDNCLSSAKASDSYTAKIWAAQADDFVQILKVVRKS